MLSACTTPEPVEKMPTFSFGAAVYLSDSFYKGCKGHIVDFRRCVYINNVRDICYAIDATCTNSNGTYNVKKNLDFIHEEDLVQDESN